MGPTKSGVQFVMKGNMHRERVKETQHVPFPAVSDLGIF